MSRHVLVVACGNFPDEFKALPNAVPLAKELHNALVALDPDDSNIYHPPVYDPDRDALVERLEAFFERLRNGDTYLLYFATHAERQENGDCIFHCADTDRTRLTETTLSFWELRRFMQHSRGIAIFDTCHGGFPAEGPPTRGLSPTTPEPDELVIGTILIWASREWQQVYDGAFARCLLEIVTTGRDIPHSEEYIRPETLVEALRVGVRGKTGFGSPHCYKMGDVGTLYVCRNPGFDERRKHGSPQAELTDFSALPVEQARSRLEKLADDITRRGRFAALAPRRSTRPTPLAPYLYFHRASGDEVCLIWSSLRFVLRVTLKLTTAFLALPLMAFTFIAWDLSLELREAAVAGLVVVALFTIWTAALVWRRKDEWRNPDETFLLVTKDGFLWHTRDGRKTALWSQVCALRTERSNYDCVLTVEPGIAKWNHGSAFGGSLDLEFVERALQWGRSYVTGRWRWNLEAEARRTEGPEYIDAAMLVGGGEYQHLGSLDASKHDLKALEACLHHELKVPIAETLPAPRRPQEVLRRANAIFEQAGPGSTVVLYFSGHGLLEGPDLFLALGETDSRRLVRTALPVYKLVALASERGISHIILILDCCFSAAGADSLGLSLDKLKLTEQYRERSNVEVTVLAATGPRQEAQALPWCSEFTLSLVEVLRNRAEACAEVSVSCVYNDVATRLASRGQNACLFALERGSNLFLAGQEHAGSVARLLEINRQERIEADRRELSSRAAALFEQLKTAGHVELPSGDWRIFWSRYKYQASWGPWLPGILAIGVALTVRGAWGDWSIPSLVMLGLAGAFAVFFVRIEAGPETPLYILLGPNGVVLQCRKTRTVLAADQLTDATYDSAQHYTSELNIEWHDAVLHLVDGTAVSLATKYEGWSVHPQEIADAIRLKIAKYKQRANSLERALVSKGR